MKTLEPFFDERTRDVVIGHQKLVEALFIDLAVEAWAGQRNALVKGSIHGGAEAQVPGVRLALVRQLH